MAAQPPDSIEAQFRILQLICGAFLASLAIYVVVARVILDRGETVVPVPDLVPWILVGVAALCLVGAQGIGSLVRASIPASASPTERVGTYRSSVIVSFAMREAAGIIGIVVALLTADWRWAVALAAAAACAMVLGWPRRSALERLAQPDRPRPIG